MHPKSDIDATTPSRSRRSPFREVIACAAAIVGVVVVVTNSPASAGNKGIGVADVVYATSPTATAVSLDGATLAGNVYVTALPPVTGQKTTSVQFAIDGQAVRTDRSTPYTLAAGAADLPAAFDTARLAEGTHTLEVQYHGRNGAHTRLQRSFAVDNVVDATPVQVSTTSTTAAPTTTTTTTAPPAPTPAPTGTVHAAPASIASDCSQDVTAALTWWIASVPNGQAGNPSVLSFAPGGCYRIEDKVTVTDRQHLVFDGNGATFKATTAGHGDRKQWQIYGGSNITFTDMTVEGVNRDIQDGAWNTATEWQHLFNFWGTQGIVIDGVVGRYAWGDFVALDADYRQPLASMPPVRNVVIRNSTFVGAGRMGVFTNYAEGVVIENNSFDGVLWSVIDLEVEHDLWHIRDVVIRNNTVGRLRHSFIGNHGNDRPVDNIVVTGNVMNHRPDSDQPAIHIIGGAVPRTGWLIEGNTLRSWKWVVHARGVRDLTIRNNVAQTGQLDVTAVEVFASTGGSVSGNDFSGYSTVLRQDNLSTGWTACGNKTGSSYTSPVAC